VSTSFLVITFTKRSSAIAEGPRDALYRLKSCQHAVQLYEN